MKCKFVKVWDSSRMGRVGFIILQVEECDTFLTEANFHPGYKFIIQASYHNVGAAGGYRFIPHYHESARETSQKLNTVESDLLGFYLSYVDDIYDLPEDLYTDNSWDTIYTVPKDHGRKGFDSEHYYKALILQHLPDFNRMYEALASVEPDLRDSVFGSETAHAEFMEMTDRMADSLKEWGHNPDEERVRLIILFIRKDSLKIEHADYVISHSDGKSIIAKYLWLPNEAISQDCWKIVQAHTAREDEYSEYTDGKLYYS